MRIKKFFIIFAALLTSSFSLINNIVACELSDKDAIVLTKNFCNKMGIPYSQEPWVRGIDYDYYLEFKDVEFGERGDYKIALQINCNYKEVTAFFNWEIEKLVREKYKIPWVTTEPHNWPPFLKEKKAKEIIFSIAEKIGLPPDVQFAQLGIDKENGIWSGRWIRKYNGFEYEEDSVKVEIIAVDGEFYLYSKRFLGKPCPTELNVKKEEAVKEGWEQIVRLFPNVDWKKYKQDYEIKSAEQKIVQPNTLAGKIVQRFSTESRLAWVVVYGLKTQPNPHKLAEIKFLKRIKIKIDAGTKKFLGGDYTQ